MGDKFKITLKISADTFASFPISESITQTRISFAPEISYFSYDGETWYDLYNYSMSGYDHVYYAQVACIKAFTQYGQLSSSVDFINLTGNFNVQTPVNIRMTVHDQYGADVNDGEVTLSINNINYTSDVVSGIADFTVSFFELGENSIYAVFNSDYYAQSNTSSVVNVSKSDIKMNISIPNVSYDEEVIANITLTAVNADKLSQNLTLIIDGKSYTVEVRNGAILFKLPDKLKIADYQAQLYFNGTDKYNPLNTTCNFTVTRLIVDMELNINQDFDNVAINIKLSKNVSEKISLAVNGEIYPVNIVNGYGGLNLNNISYGDYLVNASLSDDRYEFIYKTSAFQVKATETLINSSDIVMYYRDGTRFYAVLKDIDGNNLINKTLVININGNNYTRITDENATVSIALNLNSGNYTVTVYYTGDKKYLGFNTTGTVEIRQTIFASDIVKYFRNDTQFYALLIDYDSKPIANTNITMNINGVFYTRVSNASGVVRLNINLEAGNYTLTLTNPVSGEMQSSNVVVLSRLTENREIVKYFRNETQYTLKVVGKTGEALDDRTVKFNINGVFYYRLSNASGIARLNINLQPGKYIITAEYDGCVISDNITVLPVIESSNMQMSYRDGSSFKVKILNGQGRAYASQEVLFNINGVVYTRITDNDGIASLNINLMSGEYIITTSYNSSNTANTITIA